MEYSLTDFKILWLAMAKGIAIHKYFKIIDYYGDIDSAFENFNYKDNNLSFLTDESKQILHKTRSISYVNSIVEKWKDIRFITYTNMNYPSLLREISDYPLVLFYKGNISKINNSISIVGTRKCSKYGMDIAQDMAYSLGKQGITICSGGARGIDTNAHIGALNAKAKTVCVLGCGVDIDYPAENEKLFKDIINNDGCVCSEYLPGTKAMSNHFPARNRIVSGISKGVLVIESSIKGGSNITVNFALEQNRDVFSIPGSIYSKTSEGTNLLIKNGAILVSKYTDILNEYGWNKKHQDKNIYKNILTENEQKIFNTIEFYKTIGIDDLSNSCNIDIVELNTILMIMEINGCIKKLPGNMFTL